jgi:hypothetical protein
LVFGHEGFDVSAEPNCLPHEETVETLYLLGEHDRIVGIGYVLRPPQGRREKPRDVEFADWQAGIRAGFWRGGYYTHEEHHT